MKHFLSILVVSFVFTSSLSAQEHFLRTPGDATATSYAPVEMLDAQMNRAVSELAPLMAAGEASWEQNAPAVHRLAAEISAFGQVLGLHDQYSEFKMGASRIIQSASALSTARDFASGSAHWTELQAALKSDDTKLLSWDTPVAGTKELMQAAAFHKRQIGAKMEKLRGLDAVAGDGVALAAIFQALTANQPSAEWKEFCMQARDASYNLYITLEAFDRKHSPKNYDALGEKCANCHKK